MNPLMTLSKCLRFMGAMAATGVLVLATGCGGNDNGGGGGGGNQGFNKTSLKGQYAFTLRGIGTPDTINSYFFVEGGVFTADGNGNITSGTDDFVENFTAFSDSITGVYLINPDGSGTIQFNFPGGGASLYQITMSDVNHFYMEEADGFGTSGGSGEKQDTTAFSAIPSGTFVYQAHDLVAGAARVGAMSWAGGNITGTGDTLVSGVLLSPVSISGTAEVPGTSSGRGVVSITDDAGTSTYAYYVISSSKIRFLCGDAGALSIGQAEAQTGGPFSAASLSGNYAFGSAGETLNVQGIHSVGVFAADGGGNITSGSFDTVQDGTPVTGMTLSGSVASTYTVAASGRAVATLNLSTGATNQKVMYLVSPSRAYFFVNDATNVEDGTLDKQSTTAFTNSSMKGQYALFMDGFDNNQTLPYRDRVGTWTPDGSGNVSTSYLASGYLPSVPPLGSTTVNNLSGTYSVPTNGRATASVTGLSNNLLMYMVSANSGYILQADDGVDIGGAFTIQTKP